MCPLSLSAIQSTYPTTTELGGPMADPISDDSSGSLLVLEAESLEAVREIVRNDPFWTGNVVRIKFSFTTQ